MAYKTADVSNKEQLVLCLRRIDDDLIVHQDFIGMHPMKGTACRTNCVPHYKNILLKMNLRIQDLRGQCYDGAAAMAGAETGVATQMKAINGKCLYIHC